MAVWNNSVTDKPCACYESHRGAAAHARFLDPRNSVRMIVSQLQDAGSYSSYFIERAKRTISVLLKHLGSPVLNRYTNAHQYGSTTGVPYPHRKWVSTAEPVSRGGKV